jgi:hypothetical protein
MAQTIISGLRWIRNNVGIVGVNDNAQISICRLDSYKELELNIESMELMKMM